MAISQIWLDCKKSNESTVYNSTIGLMGAFLRRSPMEALRPRNATKATSKLAINCQEIAPVTSLQSCRYLQVLGEAGSRRPLERFLGLRLALFPPVYPHMPADVQSMDLGMEELVA